MLLGTSDKKWLAQATWFISNVGNDENSGVDSSHPLLSVAELQHRWGPDGVIPQSVTITFLTNHAGGTLRVIRGGPDIVLEVDGTATVSASDTISVFTDISTTNNQWALLTGTTITDFTTHVNKRVHYTSGPANGGVTFIALQNPQGAGNGVAEIASATTEPTLANNYFPALSTPAAGNTFNLETLTVVDALTLEVSDMSGVRHVGATNVRRPAYLVKSCVVTALAGRANSNESASRLLWGIQYGSWSDSSASYENSTVSTCLNMIVQNVLPPTQYQFSIIKSGASTVTTANTYAFFSMAFCLFEGVNLGLFADTIQGNKIGIFNATGHALTVPDGCVYVATTALLGQGNTLLGLSVGRCGLVTLGSGIVTKVTGTHGDWAFTNAIGSVFTWAQAPRANAYSSGTDTLVAGTKTIAVPNLPADARITVTRNTAGGGIGELTIPTASRTTAQFVVNSSSATDTSTFDWDWVSPSGGSGGIFNG
jgi:hypothetical protein